MNRKKSVRTKAPVVIAEGTYKKAYEMICHLLKETGYEPRKKDFFLKPNLVDAYPPRTAITTHPAVVEAVVRYLRLHYPESEIVIGDSCGVHVSFEKVKAKAGYRRLEKKYNVRVISLDSVERFSTSWKHGKMRLPKLLKTHEYINIPKMKTHLQTSVSLGIKNQKGLLETEIKKNFHRTYELHECIENLADIIKPDLTIIDGVLSMEGDGPLDTGTPRKATNLIIGSTNMIAADTVAATIMGFEPKKIRHLPNTTGYKVIGPKISDCQRPHVKPNDTYVKILNTHIYIDKTMCTQCAVPFKDAFRDPVFLLKVIGLGGLKGIKNIIFGKFTGTIEDLNNTIGFGDCTIKSAKKIGFPTVKGCPPTPDTIKENYILFLKNSKKLEQQTKKNE